VYPVTWTRAQIDADVELARKEFRTRRLGEPLAAYERIWPTARSAAGVVIGALDRLFGKPVDRTLVGDLVADKELYAALRSLSAVPVSVDDLATLLDARPGRKAILADPHLADSLMDLLRMSLDPHRFPWVVENRRPEPHELQAAMLATSVLTAVSAVQTGRRSEERDALEGEIARRLDAHGFSAGRKPKYGIRQIGDFPDPGRYVSACRFGRHNADFVVRLPDNRLLAIECKASNSEVNGFKRLNKEVVVDAGDWYRAFGRASVIACAALRGVFKPENVADAQTQDVFLFWWHRFSDLDAFLMQVREDG
jgi:hypothetical protein